MGVNVVVERAVRAGCENTVWEKLRDLRSQAVRQRGYMYGETWPIDGIVDTLTCLGFSI